MNPIGNAADYLWLLPQATLVRFPNLGHLAFDEDSVHPLPDPCEGFRKYPVEADRHFSRAISIVGEISPCFAVSWTCGRRSTASPPG